jgi:hypothetical protein
VFQLVAVLHDRSLPEAPPAVARRALGPPGEAHVIWRRIGTHDVHQASFSPPEADSRDLSWGKRLANRSADRCKSGRFAARRSEHSVTRLPAGGTERPAGAEAQPASDGRAAPARSAERLCDRSEAPRSGALVVVKQCWYQRASLHASQTLALQQISLAHWLICSTPLNSLLAAPSRAGRVRVAVDLKAWLPTPIKES